jgi:type III restriction enzyme
VDFDSSELIDKCITALEKELRITPLQYTVAAGEQKAEATYDDMNAGDSFVMRQNETGYLKSSSNSAVKYDLIGKLAEATQLTRRTVATILRGINVAVFSRFKANPEDFILKAGTIINEQKATVIVEHLAYNPLDETHTIDIFAEKKEDLSKGFKATRHIYDYVFTDSGGERTFVGELDASAEVVVYAKLPKSFYIPTPVGNYNPDWAIAFQAGKVKHVYFVAETKGSMSSMDLRKIEESKIECARKFFSKITSDQVKYEVVDSYGRLMELVK